MSKRMPLGLVSGIALGVALALAAGGGACSRREAPAPPPAPPDAGRDLGAPAPPPDAAADVRDARGDAADASGTGGGRKRAGGPPAPAAPQGGLGALQVTGAVPKAEVAKVIRAKSSALKACYDKEQARNPALRGRVSFRLTVDGRGRVSLGEVVSSTLGTSETELCMVEATRAFKFPPSPDGGESTVTFQMGFGR